MKTTESNSPNTTEDKVEQKPVAEKAESSNTKINAESIPNGEKEKSKPIDISKLNDLIPILIGLRKDNKNIDELKPLIIEHLKKLISKYPSIKDYHLLFLYDNVNSISQQMADKLYDKIPENNKKPILLVLHSGGGRIEPAYLISKVCKEYSSKFVVTIPRKAKSAATLISLGGDEIHMGSMSELGPIDPQFNGLPALALTSALDSIAQLVSKHPGSSKMFAKFLRSKIDVNILGYFERVSESAKHYAIRLLKGKTTPKTPEEIAHTFVYDFKDHSFVIDKEEATQYLGDHIKINTDEYHFSNDVHKFLSQLNNWAGYLDFKQTEIVGCFDDVTFTEENKN